MAFSLIPDRVYSSIFEIDGTERSRHGVSLLLADLDNTLALHETARPTDAVRAWVKDVTDAGIGVMIVSNNRPPARVDVYKRQGS